MAVIITQVVQLSNLPAANQGILILNLNSVFCSLSLSLFTERENHYKTHRYKTKTLKLFEVFLAEQNFVLRIESF